MQSLHRSILILAVFVGLSSTFGQSAIPDGKCFKSSSPAYLRRNPSGCFVSRRHFPALKHRLLPLISHRTMQRRLRPPKASGFGSLLFWRSRRKNLGCGNSRFDVYINASPMRRIQLSGRPHIKRRLTVKRDCGIPLSCATTKLRLATSSQAPVELFKSGKKFPTTRSQSEIIASFLREVRERGDVVLLRKHHLVYTPPRERRKAAALAHGKSAALRRRMKRIRRERLPSFQLNNVARVSSVPSLLTKVIEAVNLNVPIFARFGGEDAGDS